MTELSSTEMQDISGGDGTCGALASASCYFGIGAAVISAASGPGFIAGVGAATTACAGAIYGCSQQ